MKKRIPLLVLLTLFPSIHCIRKFPTTPPTPPEIKTGYYVYVGNEAIWAGAGVYVIDTDSHAVVDSIDGFPYSVYQLAITKGGSKLYVCTCDGPVNSPGNVYSVDLMTKEIKLILERSANVYTAPSGLVLIILKETPYTDPRHIGTIDTLTDEIHFFDVLDLWDEKENDQSVVFDPRRPIFYAPDKGLLLLAYDYERMEIIRRYQTRAVFLRMVISPDGKTLYVAGGPVFDLEADSTIVEGIGENFQGSLALSNDGEYLYITDPRKRLHDDQIIRRISIYSTKTNTVIGYPEFPDYCNEEGAATPSFS